jgi:Leucine-rich repeat (LRR) protein
MKNLKTLILGGELGGNPITTLPKELVLLTNLERLILRDCMIIEIPEEILALHSLKYLDLRGTPLNKKTIIHIEDSLKGTEILTDPQK